MERVIKMISDYLLIFCYFIGASIGAFMMCYCCHFYNFLWDGEKNG